MGKRCYLRQNESDTRDYARYDGTMLGLLAVQSVLPSGWSCSYSVNEYGVCDLSLMRRGQNSHLGDTQTYVVVDRFGSLELHDTSSFCFLFREDGEPAGDDDPLAFHIMADDGFLWGG